MTRSLTAAATVAIAGLITLVLLAAGTVGAIATSAGPGTTNALIEELVAAGYQNGRLPDDALTLVSPRCRVANVALADVTWTALVAAAAADGYDIAGGWCYRTYQAQLSAWMRRRCYIPGNCDGDPYAPTAYPGTSKHGWGLAIDIWNASNRLLSCRSPEFAWLQVHGPAYGWNHPAWAHCSNPGREPWHWEYTGLNLNQPTSDTGP